MGKKRLCNLVQTFQKHVFYSKFYKNKILER
jgi:hypothetical protein